MLSASARRIRELPDHALVLDVGAGASPLDRADWVLDLMAYDERGLYGPVPDAASERFGPETWVRRDMCDREPWPFADGQFAFAVCSHTLEDVRDPVWVCAELQRVARAGYVEVPSRLEEQTYGIQGPWVGWGHHRWLVDVGEARLAFVLKHHVMHNRPSDHFPARLHGVLSAEQRVQQLWWQGSFTASERVMTSAAELDPYLAGFVAAHAGLIPPAPSRSARLRRLAARRPGRRPRAGRDGPEPRSG